MGWFADLVGTKASRKHTGKHRGDQKMTVTRVRRQAPGGARGNVSKRSHTSASSGKTIRKSQDAWFGSR
jgi:hypothetical protein